MGGSAHHSTFSSLTPDELRHKIREAELEAARTKFMPKLAEWLGSLLAKFNNRDQKQTEKHLSIIKEALSTEFEGDFELRYGGSVAKHTFVDGLSDVDMLLIYRGNEHPDPANLIRDIARLLRKIDAEISIGTIAVTAKFSKGEEIQLVPAVREEGKLHVPRWSANEWSPIDPQKFRDGLAKRNAACAQRLIPTIKLAKSINATFPEDLRLSGYHLESMAISAFKGYDGPKIVEQMLPFYFRQMATLVKTPIKDSTGQSVHVDSDLGKANSQKRRQLADNLDRVARRMENAVAAQSLDQWKAILGL